MRITPNDVKQKRNVSAEAAESAGASCGSVTSRTRRNGPAPRTAAASALRGSIVAQAPPTMRVDDGDVEEDVRGEDRPQPALVAVREQRQERGRDDHRRQDEGDEHESPGQRAAPEAEPPDCPRERQSGGEGQDGRGGGLPGGEPEQLRRSGGEERAAARGEAAFEDRCQREGEEQRQKGHRHGDGGDASGAAQRRTACVHASIQRSRLLPISAAGSSSGFSGITA